MRCRSGYVGSTQSVSEASVKLKPCTSDSELDRQKSLEAKDSLQPNADNIKWNWGELPGDSTCSALDLATSSTVERSASGMATSAAATSAIGEEISVPGGESMVRKMFRYFSRSQSQESRDQTSSRRNRWNERRLARAGQTAAPTGGAVSAQEQGLYLSQLEALPAEQRERLLVKVPDSPTMSRKNAAVDDHADEVQPSTNGAGGAKVTLAAPAAPTGECSKDSGVASDSESAGSGWGSMEHLDQQGRDILVEPETLHCYQKTLRLNSDQLGKQPVLHTAVRQNG